MKLLGVISVDFDVSDQLLVRYSVFVSYRRKNGSIRDSTSDVYRYWVGLCLSEVFWKILINFSIPLKLVRLIKVCLNETYSKVRIGKNLSDVSLIQNGLDQGNALSPLLFNFSSEYAIRNVQEDEKGSAPSLYW